jgi:alginate O-acetyltransferase complex protein AlgI
MLFQMPEFFAFLALFFVGMAVLPKTVIPAFVFIASLVFYAWWSPPYVLLIVAFIVMGWGFAFDISRVVQHGENGAARAYKRLWLYIPLLLLPLVFFKYTDFVMESLAAVFGFTHHPLGLFLPLGISFVTFTVISLVVDTYRYAYEKPKILNVAVYVTFFPHLISGPILRSSELIPQIPKLRIVWPDVPWCMGLFAVGILKKVMIADPIGAYVDDFVVNTADLTFSTAVTITVGFAVQVYCDFSAYSDMAIALAAIFGIRFPINFNSPFLSVSLSEVWKRWHMTLSFWLRDYVYSVINRDNTMKWRALALFVTMSLSGIWHGAGWGFVVWGMLQGLFLILEKITGYARFARRQTGALRLCLIVMFFFVWSLSIVLFRAETPSDLFNIFRAIFSFENISVWHDETFYVLGACAALLLVHPFDKIALIEKYAKRIPAVYLVPVTAIIIASCSLITAGRPQNFYYFAF